jgi:hypothetical protein
MGLILEQEWKDVPALTPPAFQPMAWRASAHPVAP